MSPIVEGLGVGLAYEERGEGPAVLLVHGLASGREEWAPVAAAVGARARVIAYDRRGYGGSTAPEPYERTTVEEQAEDAAALLRGLDAAPAVVCGRDLGAVVALDLAKRYRELVTAVVLVDPALYQLAPEATEALGHEREVLEAALRGGGPVAAVEAWLAARGAPAERVRRAREHPAAFFADFAGLASWPILRRELRALDVPAAVLVSADAPAHARAAARALAELLDVAPGAESDLAEVLSGLA
jgi:pimeloyl-ACP methyl ester carboxylesterase